MLSWTAGRAYPARHPVGQQPTATVSTSQWCSAKVLHGNGAQSLICAADRCKAWRPVSTVLRVGLKLRAG
jgi:hypothetical protein